MLASQAPGLLCASAGCKWRKQPNTSSQQPRSSTNAPFPGCWLLALRLLPRPEALSSTASPGAGDQPASHLTPTHCLSGVSAANGASLSRAWACEQRKEPRPKVGALKPGARLWFLWPRPKELRVQGGRRLRAFTQSTPINKIDQPIAHEGNALPDGGRAWCALLAFIKLRRRPPPPPRQILASYDFVRAPALPMNPKRKTHSASPAQDRAFPRRAGGAHGIGRLVRCIGSAFRGGRPLRHPEQRVLVRELSLAAAPHLLVFCCGCIDHARHLVLHGCTHGTEGMKPSAHALRSYPRNQ
jgi:hypothetical protein